jgi:anti-anti-sigma regulatory factor
MNVSSRRFANAVVLAVSGRLDQDTCETFRLDLSRHVEDSARGGWSLSFGSSGRWR